MLTDVSKFMEVLLNDCSVPHYDSDLPPDPAEMSFLVLRVREACHVVLDPLRILLLKAVSGLQSSA